MQKSRCALTRRTVVLIFVVHVMCASLVLKVGSLSVGWFVLVITSPMPSLMSLNLSVAVLWRFYCCTLRYAVNLNFDPVTLTSDLWSWICVVHRLCRGQTLYQIWAKSRTVCRGVISIFNIWPDDLEHFSRVAPRSAITCTKLKFCQPIHSWLIAFCDCQYVMSRPDLDLWPLNQERVYSRSGVMCLNSISKLSEIHQRGWTKFGNDIVRSSWR